MGGFDVRWLRLAVVAGAIAGSALVSSAVVATDETPTTDEPSSAVAATGVDPAPPEVPPTAPPSTDLGDVESIVLEAPTDLSIEDVTVIEMVIVEPDVKGSGAGSDVIEPEATEPDAPETEMRSAPVVASLEQPDVGEEHDDGAGRTGHDDGAGRTGHDGHEGGNVGEGTPYLMTFDVVWLDPDQTQIDVLDAVLPLEWRSSFELSAASVTGLGPTSATCTYPADGDVLRCVFDNAGHGWESEGLIVPGGKDKTYTVTLAWSPENWTIDGANDDSYSARALCPRGGHDAGGHEDDGSEGGHEDEGGHEEEGDEGHDGGQRGQGGDDGHEGERGTYPCVHTVTIRQILVPPPVPPAVEPESEPVPAPAVMSEPDAIPPAVTQAEVVEAAPVAATPLRALPATGRSVSVVLVLAGLLVASGASLTRLTRRASWRSVEVESRPRIGSSSSASTARPGRR